MSLWIAILWSQFASQTRTALPPLYNVGLARLPLVRYRGSHYSVETCHRSCRAGQSDAHVITLAAYMHVYTFDDDMSKDKVSSDADKQIVEDIRMINRI